MSSLYSKILFGLFPRLSSSTAAALGCRTGVPGRQSELPITALAGFNHHHRRPPCPLRRPSTLLTPLPTPYNAYKRPQENFYRHRCLQQRDREDAPQRQRRREEAGNRCVDAPSPFLNNANVLYTRPRRRAGARAGDTACARTPLQASLPTSEHSLSPTEHPPS